MKTKYSILPTCGDQGKWLQMIPGKTYNVLLKLEGPPEPWFDKPSKTGDFEFVEHGK
jgi:hypothetical protein